MPGTTHEINKPSDIVPSHWKYLTDLLGEWGYSPPALTNGNGDCLLHSALPNDQVSIYGGRWKARPETCHKIRRDLWRFMMPGPWQDWAKNNNQLSDYKEDSGTGVISFNSARYNSDIEKIGNERGVTELCTNFRGVDYLDASLVVNPLSTMLGIPIIVIIPRTSPVLIRNKQNTDDVRGGDCMHGV